MDFILKKIGELPEFKELIQSIENHSLPVSLTGLSDIHKASFINACGNNKPSECVMIGDNLEVDIIGAINAGLDAIHYDEKEKAEHKYKKIKKLVN